jgi:cobalt-zinc-cadmium resistance protein CzcA
MFSPLAWTLGFALLGALLFTLTLVPVLCSMLLRKNVREKNNFIVNFFNRIVTAGFGWCYGRKRLSLASLVAVAVDGPARFSRRPCFSERSFCRSSTRAHSGWTAELPMSSSLSRK